MSKEAVERLRKHARNEATYFAMRDLCNDQRKEIDYLRDRIEQLDEQLKATLERAAKAELDLAICLDDAARNGR